MITDTQQTTMELTRKQLADITELQVRKALDRFKEHKKTSGEYFSYLLKIEHTPTPGGKFAAVAVCELHLQVPEGSILAYRKAYGFSHEVQTENEGEWKLTLMEDLLKNLVGGGIVYSLAVNQARKEEPAAFIK